MTFTVFSKPNCSFCDKAKALLSAKQLQFNVVNLDVGQPKEDGVQYIARDELIALIPTARTMPQIMLDGKVIGGFQELQAQLS